MKELLEQIKETSYNYYGVRTGAVGFKVGEYCGNSKDWDYENDCESENELNGTCATEIHFRYLGDEDEEVENITRLEKAIKFNKIYCAHTESAQYIIAGDRMEYGNDENEIIIENAVVIAIV